MSEQIVTVELDVACAKRLRELAIHHSHQENDDIAQQGADTLSEALTDVSENKTRLR